MLVPLVSHFFPFFLFFHSSLLASTFSSSFLFSLLFFLSASSSNFCLPSSHLYFSLCLFRLSVLIKLLPFPSLLFYSLYSSSPILFLPSFLCFPLRVHKSISNPPFFPLLSLLSVSLLLLLILPSTSSSLPLTPPWFQEKRVRERQHNFSFKLN